MLCTHYLHQLSYCAKHQSISLGQKLHAQILKLGLHNYGPLPNSLLEMYGKCGIIRNAVKVFDEMPHRSFVSWASILTAHNHSNQPHKTLLIFRKMWEIDGLLPDHFVISSLVRACASLGDVRLGKQVHGHFVRSPFYEDDVSKSSIVDMYSKCGVVDYGMIVFDSIRVKNTISWTAIISGYARTGRKVDSLELFSRMPVKNLMSWSALISGLVQSGHGVDAFHVFMKMRREVDHGGVDQFMLSSIAAASANMAMLELGKQVHCLIILLGFDHDLFICNSLTDMYAKCSDLFAAKSIFCRMSERDVVSWTSIIVGTVQHGQAEEALSLYDRMLGDGVKPNEVTFLGLIYACSHVGLVSKGQHLFNSMIEDYGVRPSLQHYTCLMDLLSRSGKLEVAEHLLKTMPYSPDEAAWAALLSACGKHKRTEAAVRVADQLLMLGPKDPSTLILLSNTYAAASMWENMSKVRKMMSILDCKKEPGYSCIELAKEAQVELEQVAMNRLTELTFRKLLATRGNYAVRIGINKVSRHVALAFIKRTLVRCRNFEDTGKSSFNEPVFRDVLLAVPSNNAVAASSQAERRMEARASDNILGGAKGKKSERESGPKAGRPSVSNSKGERKTKSKPKQKAAQLSTHPMQPAVFGELVGNASNRKRDDAMDLSSLPLSELDSIEDLNVANEFEGHQDLSTWLNFDEVDGLQEDDGIGGLQIPMDDLSDLNMLMSGEEDIVHC